MRAEGELVHKEFAPHDRVFIGNPLPSMLSEDPSITAELRPAKSLSGTVVKKEQEPFEGHYIVKLDAPVFYVSGPNRIVNRLEAIGASRGNMELTYDRPSLSEIK